MTQNPTKRQRLSYDSKGETSVEQDTFSFLWTVNNFSAVREMKELYSPVFRGGPKTNHGWKLIMIPKKGVNGVNYLALGLEMAEYGDEGSWWESLWRRPVKAAFQLTILDADGQPAYRGSENVKEFTRNLRFSYSWGSLMSALSDPIRRQRLVVNDTMKIHCKITIFGEVKGTLLSSPSEQERRRLSRDQLANDLGQIFKASMATDVTISSGQTSFKAHKAILMARSPVFAAMFNTNMLENERNVVEIPDFDDEVVKGMLEHLYEGHTDYIDERAPELLEIAEKYELTALKEDCEFVIADSLRNENAAAILILAHAHNAPYLKERTIYFINKNKEELLKSVAFQDAMKAHAGTDLLADLYFSQ